MKEGTLICNFSGVYGAQEFMPQEAVEVDLSGIQGTCCYCSAEEEIEAMLPEELPWQRWIDSGDYHYMSYILAKRQKEPFHLLLQRRDFILLGLAEAFRFVQLGFEESFSLGIVVR